MEMRLEFECWNCKRSYSLLREVEGKPKLNVACPFCGKEGTADLNPYQNDIVEAFKSASPTQKSFGTTLNFPQVIPTATPED